MILAGCTDPSPTPPAVCETDAPSIANAPRDQWSPLISLRERSELAQRRPLSDWLVVPLHGYLLPDGRVLLHGEMKDYNGAEANRDHNLIANDLQWIIDPNAPAPTTDMELTVRAILPWTRWTDDPNGTRTNPDGAHGGWASTELLMCGGVTWLADGRLFYAGGTGVYPRAPSEPHAPADAEGIFEGGHWKTAILDPRGALDDGSAWRVGPPMRQGMRYYPTATRLPNGDVLVVSGLFDTSLYEHTGIERFDPRANVFREFVPALMPQREVSRDDPRAGLAPHPEDYPHVFVLPTPLPASRPVSNGLSRELIVLGRRGDVSLLSVESGDGLARVTQARAWRRPGAEGDDTEERMHGASSVIFADGSVGVFAGSDSPTLAGRFDRLSITNNGEGTWRSTRLCTEEGSCHARVHPMAVLTPGGEVLLLGGRPPREGAYGDPRTPLFIDPSTGRVREGRPWPDLDWRGYHTVVVPTLDGRVLVAGGRSYAWSRCDRYGVNYCEDERPDMRWYSPPWLDPALAPLRPRITTAPTPTDGSTPALLGATPVLSRGASYRVGVATERPTTCLTAARAVLTGLPAQTHSIDMNQRVVPMSSMSVEGGLRFTVPSSASVIPPGPYVLTVVRDVRVRANNSVVPVPSVARVVMVR